MTYSDYDPTDFSDDEYYESLEKQRYEDERDNYLDILFEDFLYDFCRNNGLDVENQEDIDFVNKTYFSIINDTCNCLYLYSNEYYELKDVFNQFEGNKNEFKIYDYIFNKIITIFEEKYNMKFEILQNNSNNVPIHHTIIRYNLENIIGTKYIWESERELLFKIIYILDF
jgi:hypothetical protein